MPATVSTRGVLKPSQNRVRTSTALQGSAMWENVIGIVNEERGANTEVEALINAPQHGGGGRKAAAARRAAAAEAVIATGAFDTAITNYETLLDLAKAQGAVGSSNRGACKICGQLGHLTKQCRNQFSKFFQDHQNKTAASLEAGAGALLPAGTLPDSGASGDSLSSLSSDLSDDSTSSDSSDSEAERRRKRRKRKRKERKEDAKREKKSSHDRGSTHKSKKDKMEKKSRRDKHRKRDKDRARSRSRSPL